MSTDFKIHHQTENSIMNATLTAEPISKSKQPSPASTSKYKAWVAKAPKQPMSLEVVDLGPFGAEDVEIAVEHCALLPNASRQVSK